MSPLCPQHEGRRKSPEDPLGIPLSPDIAKIFCLQDVSKGSFKLLCLSQKYLSILLRSTVEA